ncbi:hypothetical protein [Variovorax sp. GT1P44]|uniref:hypothetical protein n=1 Tax=Variovorax sp. GT1P44 TaxID=3443742 RepID=UPI003F48FA7F
MLKGPSMRTATSFEIRFRSLFHEGRALAFPCDSQGEVDLDAMGEKARSNYLFARDMIGREYAMPFVQESTTRGLDPHRHLDREPA